MSASFELRFVLDKISEGDLRLLDAALPRLLAEHNIGIDRRRHAQALLNLVGAELVFRERMNREGL